MQEAITPSCTMCHSTSLIPRPSTPPVSIICSMQKAMKNWRCRRPGNVATTPPLLKLSYSTSSLPPPTFQSVTATRRGPTFSLKVVKATIHRQGRGKAEFQPTSHTYMYLELTEATANVEHIPGVILSRWGAGYMLVGVQRYSTFSLMKSTSPSKVAIFSSSVLSNVSRFHTRMYSL